MSPSAGIRHPGRVLRRVLRRLLPARWFREDPESVPPHRHGRRNSDPLPPELEEEGFRHGAVPTPRGIEGRLRITFHPADEDVPLSGNPGEGVLDGPVRHHHVWIPGPGYLGMEDNDIRGFLDGRFVHPWNQPGQIHVRVGRSRRGPHVGEFEILRTLQRWEGIRLPGDARVHEASLVLQVEEAEGISPGEVPEVEVYLYEVLKDWEPGRGGIQQNNNSPAAPGEVWWNEPRRGERPWGLPGCGLHSDSDPGADTPAMPLAVARYRPDQKLLIFSSPSLAAYVERRSRTGSPLGFLLKLADAMEDRPGTLLSLYSANHGDTHSTGRRPRLEVTWSSPSAVIQRETSILLEHGRRIRLPPVEVDSPGILAVSFLPGEGAIPRLLLQHGTGEDQGPREDDESPFLPLVVGPGRMELEIQALRRPVLLGDPFLTTFRDTWVRSAPPEAQVVPWYFLSPSGVVHRVTARYEGDYRWQVAFTPDEPGRWLVRWSHRFSRTPFRSPVEAFDVVVEGRNGMDALRRLTESLEGTRPGPGRKRMLAYGRPLAAIERALVTLRGDRAPFDLREADPGGGVGGELDRARKEVGGAPQPEHPRLEPKECFPIE